MCDPDTVEVVVVIVEGGGCGPDEVEDVVGGGGSDWDPDVVENDVVEGGGQVVTMLYPERVMKMVPKLDAVSVTVVIEDTVSRTV